MNILRYSDFGCAIRGVCQTWCQQQGYRDPFCHDGEWWAFPPSGVLPVRIKTVMAADSCYPVQIGPLRFSIFPDGSLADSRD